MMFRGVPGSFCAYFFVMLSMASKIFQGNLTCFKLLNIVEKAVGSSL